MIKTKLNYMDKLPEDKPFRSAKDFTSNFELEEFDVQVQDLRENRSSFNTENSGFQLIDAPVEPGVSFADEDSIKATYYPTVIDLVKKQTGAKKVLIFDHVVRRNREGQEHRYNRKPVLNVHSDQTPKSAAEWVIQYGGDEAPALLKKRYAIINVWRPINGEVVDFPLGVCDYRSLDQKDLIPMDLIFPTYVTETYYVKHNPNHKWYYADRINSDEVLFLKCFDSKTGVLTPHTAFVHPDTKPEDKKRESVEVRTLVFFDEDL